MSVYGIAIVKDEADIVDQTVRHMLTQVDHVLIADNGSTDGTRELLGDLPVDLIDDPEPAYYQSRKMTRLAARAASRGATWVVPFDADEWWYSPHGRVADVLARRSDVAFAPAALYDHVATGQDPDGTPTERIGWRRRDPAELPKMAARACLPVTILQGNHGAEYPAHTLDGQLVVRHFPYRSVDQFVRKVRNGSAAYAATDLPDHLGAHWRQWGKLLETGGEEALADVFRKWYWREDPATGITIDGERQPPLIFDPVASLCPA